jgi:hypothetical protein
MAKITLGKQPESFKRVVKFKMLDGSEGSIECDFKYRTKRAFGAFIDALVKDAAGEQAEQAPALSSTATSDAEQALSLGQLMAKTVDKNADYLLDVLVGWNLDVRLSRDALTQLADELPGAASAIMDTYRIAITEGRLGN